MSTNFLWDVFISHSAHDKSRVRQLAEHLRDAQLRVWFDEWVIQPGDDIYAAIENGLEYTRTLILCLSQAALNSDWVKLERNTTIFSDPQNKERRFVPLLLEDCDPPLVLRRLAHIDWRTNDLKALEKLCQICLPPNRKSRKRSRRILITPPTGALSSESPLYVKREADAYLIAAAHQPAETVIVKAPRQMGKSSLLISYMAACRALGKKTIFLDLASLFSSEEISNYSLFLTILAREIWEQLGRFGNAAPPLINRQAELTRYIERTLLAPIEGTVLMAFDEMDRVLGHTYQEDFFSMLRSWHNQRADTSTNWHKLGLAIAISTEPYLFIEDFLRSPFNVGLNLDLRLFNEVECQRLSRRYRVNLSAEEFRELMTLLNGHPHLTHLALYALSGPNALDFPSLLHRAANRDGPFGAHLRALEYRLTDETGVEALEVMKQIVHQSSVFTRKNFYRLHSAGLVRKDGDRIAPTNQLYADFFRDL